MYVIGLLHIKLTTHKNHLAGILWYVALSVDVSFISEAGKVSIDKLLMTEVGLVLRHAYCNPFETSAWLWT